MQRLIIPASLILCLISCKPSLTPPQQKVVEQLRKSMNDFSSYEPVEWGKVDTIYAILDSTENYQHAKLNLEVEKANEQALETIILAGDLPKSNSKSLRELDSSRMKISETEIEIRKLEAEFKPYPVGYSIMHSFRGKNALGAKMLNRANFNFDLKWNFVRAENIE